MIKNNHSDSSAKSNNIVDFNFVRGVAVTAKRNSAMELLRARVDDINKNVENKDLSKSHSLYNDSEFNY